MFGIYRYGLALCVAISHLWAGTIGGPAAYAVWGFYCLSGYLMTLILNEKYGFSPRGVGRFAANRALSNLSRVLRRVRGHVRALLLETRHGCAVVAPASDARDDAVVDILADAPDAL